VFAAPNGTVSKSNDNWKVNNSRQQVECSNVETEKLSKEDIKQEYKNLQHVEHGFRDLKSDNISIRPIYHRNEAQTRGHVQVCFWAYAIIKEMEDKIYPFLKEYNDNNKTQLAFNDMLAELRNIKLCELKIGKNNKTITFPKLNTIQESLLTLFNLKSADMIAFAK
jgi:transposase